MATSQAKALAYPPDILPGSRDVDSPYGVMKVFEWGPEPGMKVLLIHGDTTPGPMLGPIAHQLVERGCRVMIIDLWGRGYSDTPLDVHHDSRLFSMQIFFAIASSPLSWTGRASGGFSIVGFSLGGGITMAFAAHFHYLINSIVLLAPAGILRYVPADYQNPIFRYASLIPSIYLRRAIGKMLGVSLSKKSRRRQEDIGGNDLGPEVSEEAASIGKKELDIPGIVQWQFDHHEGFCHSFSDTITYGPIMSQESDWRKTCNIVKGKASPAPDVQGGSKLRNSKILVIFGESDGVVAIDDVSKDLYQMLEEHVEIKVVSGGHGFPVPSCDEVVRHVRDFWHI